ncbi:5137_t:CDS:2, partial [Ambispora leptoticha]
EGSEENVDVWDDSALISAWEKAWKEYQDHHSLKATSKTAAAATSSSSKADQKKIIIDIDKNKSQTPGAEMTTTSDHRSTQTTTQEALPENQEIKPGMKKKTRIRPNIETTTNISNDEATWGKSTYQQYPYYHHYYPTSSSSYYNYWPPSNTVVQDETTTQHQFPASPLPKTTPTPSPFPPPPLHYSYYPYGPPPLSHSYGPPPPRPPMVETDDETLANLLMAWYFSGYYTGLYQGQRR